MKIRQKVWLQDFKFDKINLMEKLTQKQRDELRAQHRKERDKRVCDRIKAVLAYDRGLSYREVSEILLLDDETIDAMSKITLSKTH